MSKDAVTVSCATCGKSIDALRAARVRFTVKQQWYFCSAAHADEFGTSGPSLAPAKKQRSIPAPPAPVPAPQPSEDEKGLGGLLAEPLPLSPLATDVAKLTAPPQPPPAAPAPPVALESALTWAPVGLAFLASLAAFISGDEFVPVLSAAVIVGLSYVWGVRQVTAWRSSWDETAATYRHRMDVHGERITSTGTKTVPAAELRPGEEVLVRPGQYVPADGSISQGEAEMSMWEGAQEAARVSTGDRVVAGALVLAGQIQVVCSKTGGERAFAPAARPTSDAVSARIQSSRISRRVTREGAIFAGMVTAGLMWMQGASPAETLAGFSAIWGALAHPIARFLPVACAESWLTWAARRGICFSHERLVDQAGAVSVAAFCARGTVLHGEPEVAEVHALRDTSETELLALAAGAESVVHHPVAAAVLRAARARDIFVDNCRSHNSTPGKGVVCVSSSGDMLVLGSREMLLRERISIALAEETLRALESRGLTALLLARNNHLIGVIALQDSLRAGAKAAVQVLLDERVEPVLISGDSRATTEAVAHALAIEHVRPEVATAGRAKEIQNLIEGGASVAVIGTSPRDDAALGAAPVPIVIEGASVSWRDAQHGKERAIGLCGRQVLASSLALLAGKRIRATGFGALVLSLIPPGVAAAAVASLLAPLYLPALVGALSAAAAMHLSLKGPETYEHSSPSA